MIITCPHCQTRYQVAYEAIGTSGRKVQCAHCQQAWNQVPVDPDTAAEDDRLFDTMAEDGLDESMAEEERRVAAEVAERLAEIERAQRQQPGASGKVDPALIRKRQRAFSRRQNQRAAQLPLAKFRRAARVIASLMLVSLLAGGYFLRTQIVERFPAAAGLYSAVGLGVNVVGLEFAGLQTLRTLRDGKDVLIVSAEIVGLKPVPVPVPPVVVTLINGDGEGIYEWSITAQARDLMAGERTRIETQLTLPPGDADRVRLSFTGGGSALGAAPPPPNANEEES